MLRDAQARVCVAAARRVAAVVAAVRRGAEEMTVIGDGLDVVVGVRVEMLPGLPLVARALDDVEEVRNHARLGKEIAVRIPINPPRIARAVREHLEFLPLRLVAPHARIDLHAILVRRTRLAHGAVREDAVAAVEPAVRPPLKSVQRLMRVVSAPSIQQHLDFARLRVVPIFHRDENEIRRRADEHSAEADLDAAHEIQPLHENGALVRIAVAIRVLEDEDAILPTQPFRRARLRLRALRIRHPLDDPHARAVVHAERDGIDDVRLGGEDLQLIARGHRRDLRGLFRRQPGELHFVGLQVRIDLRPRLLRELLGGELRLLRVKDEVVEVHMPPADGLIVHDADKNLAPLQLAQIHDRARHPLVVHTARRVDRLAIVLRHDLHARPRQRTSADEKAPPRLRRLERHRRERALRLVAQNLVTPDPKFTLAIRSLASTERPLLIDLPLHRLLVESLPRRRPIAQCAILEAKVQHTPVRARSGNRIGSG